MVKFIFECTNVTKFQLTAKTNHKKKFLIIQAYFKKQKDIHEFWFYFESHGLCLYLQLTRDCKLKKWPYINQPLILKKQKQKRWFFAFLNFKSWRTQSNQILFIRSSGAVIWPFSHVGSIFFVFSFVNTRLLGAYEDHHQMFHFHFLHTFLQMSKQLLNHVSSF